MEELKTRIAKRAARELNDGDVVNLGIGLPTMVAKNLPEGISIILQSENGIMGMGEKKDETDPNIVNAGAQPVSMFALIRGGHVDATILGALQVDVHGNLSNWIIPGKMVPGMGGAMDLVTGAKKVIVAMLHTQKGAPKILKDCTLPYTARHCMDMIITEMGVMRVTEKGIVLDEIHPDYSVEDVQNATSCDLIISEHLSPMQ